MASKTEVFSKINQILKRIENYTNIVGLENITVSQIELLYNRAIRQLDNLLDEVGNLYTAYKLEDVYRFSYNRTARNLRQQGLQIERLPRSIDTQSARVRRDFNRNMQEMINMARFNLQERQRMTTAFVESLNRGIDRRNTLYNRYGRNEVPKEALNKLAGDIAKRFNPVTGVQRFRNEYYNLDNDQFKRAYRSRWSNISESMTSILERGFRTGEQYSDIIQSMTKKIDQVFPAKSFPIPVRIAGTDQVQYRYLETRYYAELKMKYYDVSMDSLGTVNANLDAGNDTVEYVLTGDNHSEICEFMRDNGPYYSLSGESEKYEQLDVFPPAHYNCKSMLIAAPRNIRESIDPNNEEKQDSQNAIFDSPQDKRANYEGLLK